jgi:Na+-driven multidrug efflux pump
MLTSLLAEAIVVSLFFCLIVHPLHLGLLGAALASTVANIVQPVRAVGFRATPPP